jgi:hypothetical protein
MAKAKKPEQVHVYFKRKLGELTDSSRHWKPVNIPVDSPCGKECVAAIDAGAELIRHLRAAFGEQSGGDRQQIIDMVDNVCEVYICG